jgi:hypothetical protein
MAAGFDPGQARRLVHLVCTDPKVQLMTADGVQVRPVQPPQFHSLPHPTKTCQAAVAVACGSATVFNVSLCDLQLAGRRPSGQQSLNAPPGLALA